MHVGIRSASIGHCTDPESSRPLSSSYCNRTAGVLHLSVAYLEFWGLCKHPDMHLVTVQST